MKVYLLTHQRELLKNTNTGRVVMDCLNQAAERIVWQRLKPDTALLALIEQEKVALLYPAEDDQPANLDAFENFIVLDGTWQEAAKMYNRSPYLKSAPKVSLPISKASNFRLRRNQKEGGLCTAECVIELLQRKGKQVLAQQLKLKFDDLNHTAGQRSL